MADTPRVRDIMSSPVATVHRNATVGEAAGRMRDENISALLVTANPPAILTSTDILHAVAEGEPVADLDVADLMNESVETVPPTIRADEAAAMMTNFGIRHLPVVDGGDYVGIVSSTDITGQFG